MSESIHLNEDQKDCLQELMNIAFGSATAAISEIIGKYATLSIPQIHTISSNMLKEHIGKKLQEHHSYYIANQLINGDLSGENLFIIDGTSSINLVKEFDIKEDQINEDEIKDIVLEITNILSSATSGKLAAMMDAQISFSSPGIKYIKSVNDFDKRFASEYEDIIIICTKINFKEQQIDGELMLLSKKDSSEYIKKALDKVLEKL